jgi:uncharacterized repeat protein (TIGR03803 family)
MRSTLMIIVVSGSLLVGCGAPGQNMSPGSATVAQRSAMGSAQHNQPIYKLLYAFPNRKAGDRPSGSLLALNGSLYGTTSYGGSECGHYGCGTVFSLSLKPSVKETVLHSFDDLDAPDGDAPYSGVTALGNSIYGTTYTSRAGIGDGVVYSVNLKSNVETVLHQFEYSRDGRHPIGGMAAIGKTLYGTTSLGYALHGSVFSIDTSGHETIVYRFRGRPDGAVPTGDLLAIGNVLYGTTEFGGSNPGNICTEDSNNMEIGCGTVFSITLGPSGPQEKVLYRFLAGADDGKNPQGGLISVNGLLYGVTAYGGGSGYGTVFSINPSTGKEVVLHEFQSEGDGLLPVGNLAHRNGILYGATYTGTVFSMKLDGSGYTILHNFLGGRKDGSTPEAGLLLSNGIIYGTTGFGGNGSCTNGCGTIYSITP